MKLLSPAEVMQMFGIAQSTLYLWVRDNRLRPIKIGRQLRFAESEVYTAMGFQPQIAAWGHSGHPSQARIFPQQHYTLEYLNGWPSGDRNFLRVKVIGGNPDTEQHHFLEMKDRPDRFLLLSHAQELWKIENVLIETLGSERYLALHLRRRLGTLEEKYPGIRNWPFDGKNFPQSKLMIEGQKLEDTSGPLGVIEEGWFLAKGGHEQIASSYFDIATSDRVPAKVAVSVDGNFFCRVHEKKN